MKKAIATRNSERWFAYDRATYSAGMISMGDGYVSSW